MRVLPPSAPTLKKAMLFNIDKQKEELKKKKKKRYKRQKKNHVIFALYSENAVKMQHLQQTNERVNQGQNS